MSCYLGTLCLLVLLIADCVYSQSYAMPDQDHRQDPFDTIMMYDRNKEELLDPLQYSTPPTTFLENVNSNIIQLPNIQDLCSCNNFACRCCLPGINPVLKGNLCTVTIFDRSTLSIIFRVELDNRKMLGFEMSALKVPDICAPFSLPVPVTGCLRIYNMRIVDRKLQLSTSFVLRLLFAQVFEYKLASFQFGWFGIKMVLGENQLTSDKLGRRDKRPFLNAVFNLNN